MSNKRKKRSRSRQNSRKKGLSPKIVVFAIIGTILIAAIAIAVAVYRIETGGGIEDGSKESESQGEEQKEAGLSFPYELEGGKLSVSSIFQFTGSNPDNENAEGENIAALTVVNQSEQHITSAEIRVKLADETELIFEIVDMAAGQSVMVFEKENQTYDLNDVCEEITDTVEFEEEPVLMEDRISIDVQGTTVTLTNNSGEDLSNLLLHCHCLIDNSYFGGLTYTYPVESIPAGQSASVEAEDCYLGEAAVVRVSQDDGGE